MKKTSVNFVIANAVGVILMVFAAIHFASPLFGWIITGAIVAVYAVGMERYRRIWLHLANDEDLLEQYRKQVIPSPLGDGVIADRIQLVQDLRHRNVQVDSRVYSEILSARESSTAGRSPGGTVVLLGLAGTFYGLMVAVARAGMSLDGGNSSTTLQAIGDIFSSMNGIFGTSFTGLIAALILNVTHNIISGRKMSYMADVEEYTQFQLLPSFSHKKEDQESRQNAMSAQFEARMEEMVRYFAGRMENLAQESVRRMEDLYNKATVGSVQQQKEFSEASREAVSHLLAELRTADETLRNHMQNAQSNLVQQSQNFQIQQESLLSTYLDRVQAAQSQIQESNTQWSARQDSLLETFLDRLGQSALQVQQSQVERFGEQWKSAVDAMQISLSQASEKGVQAVHAVQAVAGQVADIAQRVSEQADARAQSLAAHVGDQLHQLADDVQKSFTVLAESSKSLVDSQRSLMDEMHQRQVQEKDIAAELQQGVVEAGKLMRVNQSEFQASLEMFRQGVEALLDRYSGGSAEQEAQRGFIEQLHASLEAFSEKSSEVLVENAVRTQEILLEILDHSRVTGSASQEKA